jgi:hypothetical protein
MIVYHHNWSIYTKREREREEISPVELRYVQ